MQRLPARLLAGELTTTAADTTYTSPALTRTTIAACSVTNKTGTAKYVTVTITPSGGSAYNICYQRTVQPGETLNVPGAIGQSLNIGDAIAFTAEAATTLDLVMSGYTTQP